MDTPMQGMNVPIPAPKPISEESRKIVSGLITKHDKDPKLAYEEFTKETDIRFTEGKAPNEMFGEVIDIFSKILPVYENLKKIESAKNVTNSRVLNNLLYDNSVQINEILRNEVFEIPEDVMNLSPAQEVVEYEQALIQIYNHVPNIKSSDKRQDLIWTADLLNQMIADIKMGVVIQ